MKEVTTDSDRSSTSGTTVSVAMATCGGARYIDEQLDSIATQTYLPDQLIICDDDSDDETPERILAFRERAPFEVRLIRNPERLGMTQNFEKAVSLCDGEIIFLADQDDYWQDVKVERMVAALVSNPQAGMVFSNGTVANGELHPLGYDLWQSQFFNAREQLMVRQHRAPEVFLKHVVAAGTTMAFRSSYKELLHPFPKVWSTHDAWIAFIIASVSDCIILPENLIRYRLHGENQVGLRRYNLLDQYQQAKKQLTNGAFANAEEFFTLARERLENSSADLRLLTLIEAKINHSRIRNEMSSSLIARLPAMFAEAASGRYWRYSYGAKSIAQDIWLR